MTLRAIYDYAVMKMQRDNWVRFQHPGIVPPEEEAPRSMTRLACRASLLPAEDL